MSSSLSSSSFFRFVDFGRLELFGVFFNFLIVSLFFSLLSSLSYTFHVIVVVVLVVTSSSRCNREVIDISSFPSPRRSHVERRPRSCLRPPRGQSRRNHSNSNCNNLIRSALVSSYCNVVNVFSPPVVQFHWALGRHPFTRIVHFDC